MCKNNIDKYIDLGHIGRYSPCKGLATYTICIGGCGAPCTCALRGRSRNRRKSIERSLKIGAEGRTRRAVGASGLVVVCTRVPRVCVQPVPRRARRRCTAADVVVPTPSPRRRRRVSAAAVSDDRSGVCSERIVTIAPASAHYIHILLYAYILIHVV